MVIISKADLVLLLSATTTHADSEELNITAVDQEQRATEILSKFADDVDYIETDVNRSDYRLEQLLPRDYVRHMFDKTTSLVNVYTNFFILTASGRPEITNESLRGKRIEMLNRLVGMFEVASTVSSELCKPFGGLDCELLPEPIQNHTIIPPHAQTFEALSAELKKVRENVKKNVSVKAVENYRGLVPVCETFDIDRYLGRLANLTNKGCEKAESEEGSVEQLMRDEMMAYASDNSFAGGFENRCLQFFVARYKCHSRNAIEKLKKSIGKHLTLSIHIQAFCVPFIKTMPVHKRNYRARLEEIAKALRLGMQSLARVQMTDTECATTTSATTSTTTQKAHSNATESHVPWRREAERTVINAISEASKAVMAKSWEDRASKLNPEALRRISEKLNKTEAYPGYSFHVALYLPLNADNMHCVRSGPNTIHGITNEGNYVVQPLANDRKALSQSNWDKVDKDKDRKNKILDSIFSTSSSDMCGRLVAAAKNIENDLGFRLASEFSAAAVVKCGYTFVWYQLGYRFFHAVSANSGYELSTELSDDTEYSPVCGQVIFFP